MGMSDADFNKWLTLFIIRKTSESEDKKKEKDNDKQLFILKGVHVKRRGSKDDFQDKWMVFEPKKRTRAYKSFGQNVKGQNAPFPLHNQYTNSFPFLDT